MSNKEFFKREAITAQQSLGLRHLYNLNSETGVA
ncbi:hypothetical protein EMIT091MI3_190068 [Kosakonia quasisacchari]